MMAYWVPPVVAVRASVSAVVFPSGAAMAFAVTVTAEEAQGLVAKASL
jgi:hypothetical protein